MRVLLVEDNLGDAVLVRELVRELGAGIDLEHVDRLSLGLERLSAGGIDAVLLDLSLPDSMGLETLRRLVGDGMPPVVVLTGEHDERLGVEAVRLGAQDYLPKDQLALPLFTRALDYAVERHAVQREREEAARRLASLEAERAAAAEAHLHAVFLAEASRVLATSLDENSVLEAAAELIVSALCDVCLIDRIDDGVVRRASAATSVRAPDSLRRDLQSDQVDPSAHAGPGRAMREGVVLLDSDERVLFQAERTPPVPEPEGPYPPLRPRVVIMPLLGRERILGALTVARLEPSAEFRAPELALVESLAARIALSVDASLLYQQARDGVRMRDEFLSIASHELNTPITSLQLCMQSLLRKARGERKVGHPPDAHTAAMLNRADRQIARVVRLIDDLLDATRVRAGNLDLQIESVDVDALVRQVADSFNLDLAASGSTLTIRSPGAIECLSDRGRLERVLTNLVSNAIKYGLGKPIEVSVDRFGNLAKVVVVDHGIGIDAKHRASIFEPFERARGVRHYGGLGLGLYIVRRSVEVLGGRVGFESELGSGSSFFVELPCLPRESELRLSEDHGAPPNPGALGKFDSAHPKSGARHT